MKITSDFKLNIKIKETVDIVEKATTAGLTDVVVDIANYAINHSPWLYGNNARSIMFEVGPGGQVAKEKNTGAVYSTSGYGGYLETGTVKMGPRPYFKPGLDLNIKNLPKFIKAHLR